jgi:hypothetical protein
MTLQMREIATDDTIIYRHNSHYSAAIVAVYGVAKTIIPLAVSLRHPASCNAARKPHRAHIYHHYVAITIMRRVAIIIHMRRSIAYTREDTQRPDFFPKTNPCLATALKT